ncbi:hypothetical protein L6452_33514 [Arctium lappa]|uniref:Uncharacterized protein n=1 Tax=Arctium lappa TaxID=4217 RepID=A0ACB8YG91_ARCLA|nr:hypothetical protein L6452_33514 [Arctium lappa]
MRNLVFTVSEGKKEPACEKIFMSDVVVTRKRSIFRGGVWRSLDVKMGVWFLTVHLLALFAPFTFTWGAFWTAFFCHVLFSMLGITVSFHRNLAHRSFKLSKWLEYTFAYLGVQAVQGVRLVWSYHVTFLVNSACHIWGNQSWNTRDLSKNNWWVAMVTFGEGWHNNHHAFEFSARFGLEWWQFDSGWCIIRFLEALGLATNVKLPTETHKLKKSFASTN